MGQANQVNDISNGTSVSQTNLNDNQTIAQRVSVMQVNQLNAWNQQVQSIHNLETDINTTSSVPNTFLGFNDTSSNSRSPLQDQDFVTGQMTLANGSTKQVQAIEFAWYRGGISKSSNVSLSNSAVWSPIHKPTQYVSATSSNGPAGTLYVKRSDSTYSRIYLMKQGRPNQWNA